MQPPRKRKREGGKRESNKRPKSRVPSKMPPKLKVASRKRVLKLSQFIVDDVRKSKAR